MDTRLKLPIFLLASVRVALSQLSLHELVNRHPSLSLQNGNTNVFFFSWHVFQTSVYIVCMLRLPKVLFQSFYDTESDFCAALGFLINVTKACLHF